MVITSCSIPTRGGGRGGQKSLSRRVPKEALRIFLYAWTFLVLAPGARDVVSNIFHFSDGVSNLQDVEKDREMQNHFKI